MITEIGTILKYLLDPQKCWTLNKRPEKYGYVKLRYKGLRTPAHRAMYRICRTDIPKELQLDHLCRRKSVYKYQEK